MRDVGMAVESVVSDSLRNCALTMHDNACQGSTSRMVSPSSLPPEFDRGVVTTVHQGDCLVSSETDLTYSTVLGWCISACIRDRDAKVGGMNHFLLAEQSGIGARTATAPRRATARSPWNS